MDPLLLEALRFGVAILAGGIVAVIAQRIAFRDAQVLAARDLARRDAALRRALAAELGENMRRLGGPVVTAMPAARIVRTAWDQARVLPLLPATFDAIASAYALGDAVDGLVAMVLARATSKGLVKSAEEESRLGENARGLILADATRAYAAFQKARAALTAEAAEPDV